MRTAFIETLFALAKVDPRLFLVVGDLGFGVVDRFARELPNQYVNAGVAEQNMTGLAAGLALSGRIVFTYSIANFPTLRPLEQVRNDVCYHRANVKIVAVGGGTTYGALGASHFATEDLAVMRAMPNLTVVAPGDPTEAELATRAVAAHDGPCYLRLGRAGETRIHAAPPAFSLGKAVVLREGNDLTLVSTGGMLKHVVELVGLLEKDGVSAGVLSMHTLKPLDAETLIACASRSRCVVTIEEHSVIGGLGGACAEALCEAGLPGLAFLRLGFPSAFSPHVGGQDYLLAQHGLDASGLYQSVRRFLGM